MDVRTKILTGAEEAFRRYGIKSMTMDDISRNLGISKKTIYQYFKNKNELVLLSLENHLNNEKVYFDQIGETSKDAVEQLVIMSRYMKQMLTQMNPSLLLDMQKFYPKAWEYFQDHKYECITDSLIKNLNKGIAEGNYREGINTEVLARFRVEQIQLGFDPHIYPIDKFSPMDVQLELMEHFIMGIITEKGLELFNKYMNENV